MKLVGSGNQSRQDFLFDASGSLSSGAAQLVLPRSTSRSMLTLQNVGGNSMWVEIGFARATCTISGGAVNAISVANAGFNYTYPPYVRFFGGGNAGNGQFLGAGQPDYPAPSHPATAHCVMGGSPGALTVSSIVIDDGGSGYVKAPMVFLVNSDLDPFGCAVPSANVGYLLAASGGSLSFTGTTCPTDPIGILGTTGDHFTCKWMN